MGISCSSVEVGRNVWEDKRDQHQYGNYPEHHLVNPPCLREGADLAGQAFRIWTIDALPGEEKSDQRHGDEQWAIWFQSRQVPTIVLCHGYRIDRSHLRSVAAIEYACGYNILLFDFRGHGGSESVMTSGGNAEVHDLEAAIVTAGRQLETLPGRIILQGFSMGASVTLLTPPHPDVVAIIADSPFARSDEMLQRIVCYQMTQAYNGLKPQLRQLGHLLPAIAWAIIAASIIVFRVRFGYGFVARTDRSFRRWKPKSKGRGWVQPTLAEHSAPILLVHATGDNLIPFAHARQIAAEAKAYGVPLETYFADAQTHCGVYGYDPLGYARVLQSFLSRALGSDLPEQHRFVS